MIVAGCSPTRRIQDGEYLLARSRIYLDKKDIEKPEFKKFEKQSPNRRILGLKFHLFLYNLASPEKDKFPSSWLREIGEAPKIWDPLLTEKTTEQFRKFLENKGYYEAKVSDTVLFKKKRAITRYTINFGEPVKISSIKYKSEDPTVLDLVLHDTINRLLNPGDRFDKETIQNERQRIEDFFKNRGYYKFLKEFVFFEAKEQDNSKKIELIIIIKDNAYGSIDPIIKVRKHKLYKINSVFIYPNFVQPTKKMQKIILQPDTVVFDESHVIYFGNRFIKPGAVTAPNLSTPGSLYSLNNVKKTYNNYTDIGLYRIVNINFKDNDETSAYDSNQMGKLEAYIELYPRKRHAFTYEIVGTYTKEKNYFGTRLNLTYNNYNFFGGAEHLLFKLTGAAENLEFKTNSKPTKIAGAETTITFPKFFVPFRADRFTKKFNPKTVVSAIYNYQEREDYTSTSANASFGYIWKGNSYNRNTLIPVDFIYVWLPTGIDSSRTAEFQKSAMINKFYDHAILSAHYQFEFSNQIIEKPSDYVFLRINLETGGNLVKGSMNLFNWNDSIFGVEYYQFVRADIDLRFNSQLNRYNRVVYRLFAGIGFPYGNSNTLPFEKMYASGDANGLRAWSPFTLGPGNDASGYSYIRHLGDIKLEGNIEYRYDLFWKLEGALFVDAGNIWAIDDPMDRPDTEFKWDGFLDDIAVGAGIGIRFDLSFLVLRTDVGYKLRDPRITKGSKWIDANKTSPDLPNFNKRYCFQFAIGYPF